MENKPQAQAQAQAHHIVVHMHPIEHATQCILRIQAVSRTTDYLNEYGQVYGDSRGDTYSCFYNLAKWWDRLLDDFKYKTFRGITLSEAGRGIWTVACNDDRNLSPWFSQTLLPYLAMRLKGYNEEDGQEPTDVLASLQELCDYQSIPIQSILKEVPSDGGTEGMTFRLRHPEKHFAKPDRYVLTAEDIFAMLLCYDGCNMDLYARLREEERQQREKKVEKETGKETGKETDKETDIDAYGIHRVHTTVSSHSQKSLLKSTGFCIFKGDDHQGFLVNQTTFHEDDILNNLDALGIDYKKYFSMRLEDHKFRDLKFNVLHPVSAYEKGMMGCALDAFDDKHAHDECAGGQLSIGLRTRTISDAEVNAIRIASMMKPAPTTKIVKNGQKMPDLSSWTGPYAPALSNDVCTASATVSRAETATVDPVHPTYYYVYTNTVSKRKHLFDFEIHYLKELIQVCKTSLHTMIGKDLLKQMMDAMNVPNGTDCMQDISAIVSMMGCLSQTEDPSEGPIKETDGYNPNQNSNTTLNKKKKETAVLYPILRSDKDTQRFYTQQYVEKYKDDAAEMLAHLAIDCVFHYLCKYILPDRVNLNQIGYDLVDLGVRKTRKSRGHVYGLATPPPEPSVREHFLNIHNSSWEISIPAT